MSASLCVFVHLHIRAGTHTRTETHQCYLAQGLPRNTDNEYVRARDDCRCSRLVSQHAELAHNLCACTYVSEYVRL
jgi:hypothetical protein